MTALEQADRKVECQDPVFCGYSKTSGNPHGHWVYRIPWANSVEQPARQGITTLLARALEIQFLTRLIELPQALDVGKAEQGVAHQCLQYGGPIA